MTKKHPVLDDIATLTFDMGRCLRQKMLQCDIGGLHMPQVHTLLFVQNKPGLTMKELALMLRVTSPSATSFVDRLVKMGYLRRASDATNRKLVRLHLTESGAKALKSTMTERRKMLVDILSILPISDQKLLKSVMHKLIQHCS